MASYIKIKRENIILHGITHNPWGEHRFIVYRNKDKQIRINTDYYKIKDGIYECCVYYDRGLCHTIEEFR